MPIIRDTCVISVDAKMLADPTISCELKGFLALLDCLTDDEVHMGSPEFKSKCKEDKKKLDRIVREGVRSGYILKSKSKNKLTGDYDYEITYD